MDESEYVEGHRSPETDLKAERKAPEFESEAEKEIM